MPSLLHRLALLLSCLCRVILEGWVSCYQHYMLCWWGGNDLGCSTVVSHVPRVVYSEELLAVHARYGDCEGSHVWTVSGFSFGKSMEFLKQQHYSRVGFAASSHTRNLKNCLYVLETKVPYLLLLRCNLRDVTSVSWGMYAQYPEMGARHLGCGLHNCKRLAICNLYNLRTLE